MSNTEHEVTATLSAVITRADGTVEDLGVLDAEIEITPELIQHLKETGQWPQS